MTDNLIAAALIDEPLLWVVPLFALAILAAVLREAWWKPRQHRKAAQFERKLVASIGRELAERRRLQRSAGFGARKGRSV